MLSEEGDLLELSKMAGISPEILYKGADLSGVNLKGKKIDLFIKAGCDFDAADLTPEQRRRLMKAKRIAARAKKRQDDVAGYVKLIHDFVNRSVAKGRPLLRENRNFDIEALLRAALLTPLMEINEFDSSTSSDYFYKALSNLKVFVFSENEKFFSELFHLLGLMRCSVTDKAVEVVKEYEVRLPERDMGAMISAFHPEPALDDYWLSSSIAKERAAKVSEVRELHPIAVERAVYRIDGADDVVEFLSHCNFTCDGDTAERIAAAVSNSEWPSIDTRKFLSAPINYRVSSALFRQVVSQAIPERIVEVVKWLEGNRGAAGALSLENAFQKIPDFEMAWELARDISPRLSENQKAVVRNSLKKLARKSEDRARVRALL
jgi:hypothetical protein